MAELVKRDLLHRRALPLAVGRAVKGRPAYWIRDLHASRSLAGTALTCFLAGGVAGTCSAAGSRTGSARSAPSSSERR